MDRVELEKRTKRFALKIIQFSVTLPKSKVGDVITYQLVKAGTSVGANYREANRAESRNDFIHKIILAGAMRGGKSREHGAAPVALTRVGRAASNLHQRRAYCEGRTSRKCVKRIAVLQFEIRNSKSEIEYV